MDSAGEKDAHKRTGTSCIKTGPGTFLKVQEMKSLHIQMENIAALTYFLKMGDTKNLQMVCLFEQIWKLLLRKKVTVTAEYLPSALNKHADIESRRKADSLEWKLAPSVFQRLCVKMGKPLIELFASRVSHHLSTYVAWRRDSYSVAKNAFSITWNKEFYYTFPRFCLITQVLNKIEKHKTKKLILITLSWQTQLWYP